ncbi:MAG: di-heme-cytochrome C peroxidase, partial [Methylococcales bacterium]
MHKKLADWFLPYHTIMSIALPASNPWGPVRLDAVGMIFNRFTGLDIGTSPDHIIRSNIRLADAPVRYPFLWNAAIQDKTQWPGFAENGNDLLGLARNFGEVVGVFAEFYPKKAPWRILGIDYLKDNSANFDGLKKLEDLIKIIGPPQWPWQQGEWAVNQELAAQGKAIYESTTKTESGGCIGCHGIRPGVPRTRHKTWATPLCDVKTDVREFGLFTWTVDSGVLAGAKIPFGDPPLKAKGELAIKVLGVGGMGALLQYAASPIIHDLEIKAQNNLAIAEKLAGKIKQAKTNALSDDLSKHQSDMVTPETSVLKGAYHSMPDSSNAPQSGEVACKDLFTDPSPAIAYESRVLEGIWATAPYLHNGSVPTLAALLDPVENRPLEFKVGPAYDPGKIGLAVEQTKFDYVLKTTD